MRVKSYVDFDGNRVKIGDRIATVDVVSGETKQDMGIVSDVFKHGFFVHPQTNLTKRQDELWGKFTRKIR